MSLGFFCESSSNDTWPSYMKYLYDGDQLPTSFTVSSQAQRNSENTELSS